MSNSASRDQSEDEAGLHDRLEKNVSVVKSQIADLSQQLTDAVQTASGAAQEQAKRGYHSARANAQQVISGASQRAGAVAGNMQQTAASIADTLENAIQERPLAALGLALGLGFLIGTTWRR